MVSVASAGAGVRHSALGLHALSHLLDTHHHVGAWVVYLEFAGLATSTVLFAIALRYSLIEEKATPR